jgi:heme exporter protein C
MSTLLRASNILVFATAGLTLLALWMVFFWVPTEVNQGNIQRIVYIHVPVAWGSMLAIILVAVASFAYLRTKNEFWDRLAVATAETGVVFGALMLLTGMIWARPVWGVWWTGEAKLTTALILFFIYIAYLMFRAYFPPGAQRQRLAAIIGLIGAIDTPIVYYAAELWSQAHPPAVVGPAADSDSAFSSEFGITLLVATIAFTFLFIYIAKERFSMREVEDQLVDLRRRAGGLKSAPASREG